MRLVSNAFFADSIFTLCKYSTGVFPVALINLLSKFRLPTENLMGEMRKYLDICPAIRCFSFHIYDHDREGRREIMRKMIGYLAEGAIRPSIFKRFKLSEVRAAHELLDSGAAFGKIVMTPD